MSAADQWLAKIAKLKVDRASGDPAPHKPLLLLVVLDIAEHGDLPAKVLPLTPELAFQFCTYWTVVAHRRKQRPDVRLPFHHLQSDGFWSCLAEDGKPSTDFHVTRYAALDPEFTALADDSAFRDQARRLLIAKYFRPQECVALATLVGIPVPSAGDVSQICEAIEPEEARKQGRDARFRLNVVAAYGYACALTGYRLTTITGGTIVDAAHIHQFASSRNNDAGNGLALCKNAHWLFDNGLWSLSDDFKVLVAVSHFSEDCADQKALGAYNGQRIRLPSDKSLWPSPIHISWHRKHKFRSD